MHYVKATVIITICIAVLFTVMAIFALAWPILLIVGLIFAVGQIIKAVDKEKKGL